VQYDEWSQQVFNSRLPSTIWDTKLHASYPTDSVWFSKSYNALLSVEKEYAEHLLADIRQENTRGEVVEFGIYQGDWINYLFDVTDRLGLPREIWGFDSFQGLSHPNPNYDSNFWKEGMYSASLVDVRERVNAQKRPRIKLVEGFFSESLKSAQAEKLGEVCFARIDCDLYQPACECLKFLTHRLSDGSVLVFDDWTHDNRMGEGRAFAEWVPTAPHLKFEFLCLGPWDHLYLRVRHR
jgi:hypothetical protein